MKVVFGLLFINTFGFQISLIIFWIGWTTCYDIRVLSNGWFGEFKKL